MQQFGNLLLSLVCVVLPFIVILFVVVVGIGVWTPEPMARSARPASGAAECRWR